MVHRRPILEHRRPIVVVGSINMDLVTRTPRVPAPGETLIGTGFVTTPGGKGANQAVAVARLGYPVVMLGKVGEDVFGRALIQNLDAAGVDTSAVVVEAGPSGVAPIMLAEDGQNSIVVVPGANAMVDEAYIEAHADRIRSAAMVLCQLEVPMRTVEYTAALCSAAGVPLILDPAPAALLPDSLWSKLTWITPNETEAIFYVGSKLPVKETAHSLLGKGVGNVVLKRGVNGAYVTTTGGLEQVPAYQVKAIDTVAAGDCFNGAFAVALLEGKGPLDAARFGSAAAAISVTRRGAQESMPTRAEVESFLRSNLDKAG